MTYWEAIAPSLTLAALAAAILPWFNRDWTPVRVAALFVCLLVSWRYILWRIFETLPPNEHTLDFALGVLFTSVEAISIVGLTASWIFLMRTRSRSQEANENIPWLLGSAGAPKIDVLICTYNEDQSILERTIIGALAMTYPNYRIWVCDDGRRAWLRDLCARYDVGYLTRPDNAHAKAGNINAALRHLNTLEEKPVFVSVLDADFVPLPDFLTRAAALMHDRRVGIVQTPQHFFNTDPIQSNLSLARVFPDEQRFFFDVIMASKDAWDGAFCCGTSSVLRFSALIHVGGFPTDSVTEDYHVSLRMRQNGFNTVYLNEVLSLGLAPEGMAEYVGQRSRWCLGLVQICRGPSGPLRAGNRLTIIDRIMLCEAFLYWSSNHAFRLLAIIVPALFLLFDVRAVDTTTKEALYHVLPYFIAHSSIFLWLTERRVLPIMSDLYQLLCATDVLKATVTGLFRPSKQKFKVTAKGGDRSQKFVQWHMLNTFLAYLMITLCGIAATFLFDDAKAVPETAIMALVWSWYNIAVILLACYVCIEQAQRRSGDRFRSDEVVHVKAGGRLLVLRAYDISVTGMRLIGEIPGPIGQPVRMQFGNITLNANIVRTTPDGFAVRFETSQDTRVAVMRHLFSGRYSTSVERIRPLQVARAIGVRVFR